MEVRKLPGVVFACKSLGKDEKGRVCFIPTSKVLFSLQLYIINFLNLKY